MKKFVFVVGLLVFATYTNAQVIDGIHDKLAEFYAAERWEDCCFKADRMILQEKYQNDPEVYLYLAASYTRIFLMGLEDTTLIYKVPEYVNAYKYALKYSVVAKKKDKKAKFYFPKNDFMLEEIAIAGIHYIDHYLSIKKPSKANSYMRKIMKTYTDVNLYFMHGVLSCMSADSVTGRTVIDSVFYTMDKARPKTVSKTEFIMVDAFDHYVGFLLNRPVPLTDSARNIVMRGLRYFPGDELLSYDLKLIDNPGLDIPKPANSKKKLALKQIAVKLPGADDDVEEDEE
jgi:hypothetical protein